MSMSLKADPSGNSGAIQINGVDKVVITNAGDVAATTFTGNLIGNANTATKFTATVGTPPVFGARAWVNFDGTRDSSGAVSTANTNRLIRGSGNVSAVLRNGTGDYSLFFTDPMPDANYCIVGVGQLVSGLAHIICIRPAIATNGFGIYTGTAHEPGNQPGTPWDQDYVSLAVFR